MNANINEQYAQAYRNLQELAKSLELDKIAHNEGRVNRLAEHTRQYNANYDFIKKCEEWAAQVGHIFPAAS